jgi:hypothetical protein
MKLRGFFRLLISPALVLHAGIVSPDTNLTAREQQIVIASKRVEAAPEFHGAGIIGIHPNTPLIYSVPVTTERPIFFSAKHLPDGISIDPRSGIISAGESRRV